MKYRKLPVIIEAIKYSGHPMQKDELKKFVGDSLIMDIDFTAYEDGVFGKRPTTLPSVTVKIKTLEGEMLANHGDYIIKGISGEFYPCKPDIFEKTYEPVESEENE